MTLTRLTPEDYITTRWSGGATTELLIRPRGAAYAQRAFLCRISSATVELDESTFTPLPDYDRLIATLEGEIDLIHDGGDSIHLRPYEVHAFDGGSATRSFGRCRDFNLMLRKGAAEGEMEALLPEDSLELAADPRGGVQLLYCVRGRCLAESGENRAELCPGESLLTEGNRSVRLNAEGGSALMRCRMRGKENIK